MKKDKETTKKYIENAFIVLSFITIALFIGIKKISSPVSDLDELWNYNTARCILNGLIPYKQISMITTPLLPTIVAFILKITADELIAFRVIHTALAVAILFMAYKILIKLTSNKKLSMISVFFMLFIYNKRIALDYNYLALLIFLIIVYIQIGKKEYSKKTNLLLGLLAGLTICTKQTVGVIIAFYTIFASLLHFEKKQFLKDSLYRIIGIMIPAFGFVIYLVIMQSLGDFIDYAILGIKTFSNAIPYKELISSSNLYVAALSIILPAFILLSVVFLLIHIFKKKSDNNNIEKNIALLTASAFPMLITIYPIADEIHFLIGTLMVLICIIYIVYIGMKYVYEHIEANIKKYIILTVEIFIILLSYEKIAISIFNNTFKYTSMLHKAQDNRIETEKTIEHFNYVDIGKAFIEMENELNSFITKKEAQGYQVYIADAEACIYDIPLNRYSKNYDMFLKGNIGKDGEEGIINNIEQSKDSIYLIKKQGLKLNWQTPTKVIEHIRNNLKKDGEISIFEIYYKE